MKKESIKQWFSRVFTRDINLPRATWIYLFFSLLSITLVAEAFLFRYTILTGGVLFIDIEIYILLSILAVSFLISGIIVDSIKDRTKYFKIMLFFCIVGLFISAIPKNLLYFSGLLIVLLAIPQLIILWFTIFVHETNILNRGRIAAYLIISCFSLGYVSVLFIIFEFLYPFLSILEFIVFIVILWFSQKYQYIETRERLESAKKYGNIIFEKHFFRYSSSFTILSFILGDLLQRYSFEVNLIIYGIASFLYLIIAGCFLDNIGRKISIVLGILVLSFFLVSYGSYIEADYIFGMPRKIFLSIHYGFSILPLLLAIFTISGDFSTERGNLKYRGRINGFFMALLFFGAIIGFIFSRWINDLYDKFPDLNKVIPNFPNLLNGFVLIILLVWMMAMKEFLVSKEKQWANALKNMFVFNKHGVCLYNHNFEQKYLLKEEETKEIDEDLISSVLSGIISIISEITQSKKQLRQIQKEEVTLLFTYGKNHVIALMVTMELPVLFKKLDDFSHEFEQKFSNELKNFSGNVQRFSPTRVLVVKYFSQKYGVVAD
ncbi:MAG: MFS transporter [Candidatus Thorarchaeota archaeon]